MEEIKQYLLDRGFVEVDETVFELVQTQVQQIMINNQVMNQEHKRVLRIVYIGEGSIDDEVIWGFSLYQDDHHIIDEWVNGLEQFKKIL